MEIGQENLFAIEALLAVSPHYPQSVFDLTEFNIALDIWLTYCMLHI